VTDPQAHSCNDCIPFAVLFFDGGLISAFTDGDFRLCDPEGRESSKHSDDPVETVEAMIDAGAVLFPYAFYAEPWSIES